MKMQWTKNTNLVIKKNKEYLRNEMQTLKICGNKGKIFLFEDRQLGL